MAVYTVEAAARERGVPAAEMVKSILLVDGDGRYVMACVTGNARLDPKAVREKLPGWRRLQFAKSEEITRVTGYVQGAVAPVDLPKDVPVIFDPGIRRCDRVNISSGDPMCGVELDPEDLIRVAGAVVWPIARES
jgi:prolyl-tRNA editing enzyme YbaK/EbsC (Cys-tRNA(Pro) deacylase)